MAQPAIDLQAPRTRTDLTLARIGRAWRYRPRGPDFTRALLEFLRVQQSRATLRSYSYALLELFDWLEREHDRIATPDELRRADAVDYARWLRDRRHGLRAFRLEQEPDRRMDWLIYAYVRAKPDARIDDIRQELARHRELVTTVMRDGRVVAILRVDERAELTGGLAHRLGCLVLRKTLTRSPTLTQIRRSAVSIEGWTEGMQAQAGRGFEVPAELFRYRVPELPTAPGDDRSSGITTRLTALSSFWSHLMNSGENDGRPPLLQANIWQAPLKTARRKAPSHQAVGRADKTPSADLLIDLLATTYSALGPEEAAAAAKAALYGTVVTTKLDRTTFADLRDRALIIFMVQAGGPRAAEVGLLKRRDVAGDPPRVTILGKGGKKRQLVMPPAALAALRQLGEKLRRMGVHQARNDRDLRADRLLLPEAPLFPAIAHWGKNAGASDMRGLSRPALAMMLRRRAIEAGVVPGSDAFKRVHPHGLRHLFASMAIASGTHINVVQAMMGHASGATTLRYMEERRPEALIAEAFRAPPVPEPPAAVPPPPPLPEPAPPRAAPPRTPRLVRRVPQEVVPAPAPARPLRPTPAPVREVPYVVWEQRLGRALTEEERQSLRACQQQPSATLRHLCAIYELDWGEPDRRTRIVTDAEELREIEQDVALAGLEAEIFGTDEPEAGLIARAGASRLMHTYAGRRSGLVWWDGTAGDLRPQMPVLSRRQVGRCTANEQDEICGGLLDLWRAWMGDGGRGPTAAAALVDWIAEALDEAAQVELVIDARAGRWVQPGAPWDETKLGGSKKKPTPRIVFREHEPAYVLSWFADVAWQYRTSRGRLAGGILEVSEREQKVIGAPLIAPDWYADPDPIAALPRADRQELLDLIGVLVGNYDLEDDTRRYDDASRAEIARIIRAMAEYDALLDDVREARRERSAAKGTPIYAAGAEVVAAAKALAADQAAAVDAMVRRSSAGRRHPDFDIAAEVKDRVKTRVKAREYRHGFYMRMVDKLFGKSASLDPLLIRVAETRPGVLEPYADLLGPDRMAQTIRHTASFKRAFADETGAHSECVGRRIARELWMLWRARTDHEQNVAALVEQTGVDAKTVNQWMRDKDVDVRDAAELKAATRELGIARAVPANIKAFDRRKDLLDLVGSMRAFKVPCPAAQEHELRTMLGQPTEPVPVFAAWAAAQEEIAAMEPERRREIMEEFVGFEEAFESARAGELIANPRGRQHRYTAGAAAMMPTPVHIALAVGVR